MSISANSQTATDYVRQGWDKDEQKDYIGAIANYNKAIQIDPKYGNAFFFQSTGQKTA